MPTSRGPASEVTARRLIPVPRLTRTASPGPPPGNAVTVAQTRPRRARRGRCLPRVAGHGRAVLLVTADGTQGAEGGLTLVQETLVASGCVARPESGVSWFFSERSVYPEKDHEALVVRIPLTFRLFQKAILNADESTAEAAVGCPGGRRGPLSTRHTAHGARAAPCGS